MMAEMGRRIRVLLVDDEPEFLQATSKALARRGFDPREALDGETALTTLGEEPFDVVVLDVKMPGLDGFTVFQEVRRRLPALPVIILTGHGSASQAAETFQRGGYDYLTKPCDVEKLAGAARAAVASAEATRSGPAIDAEEEPIRLLLIDDEDDLLISLATAFRRRGMQVVTAHNGFEGLDLLREQPFDVVLLDLAMPLMGGIDVLSRIKERDPLAEVILLTGRPSMGTAAEGLREGIFDYLVKPQSIETLTGRIRDASRHRKMQLKRRDRTPP
jgi:DNA-binding NtrC family response regulator